MLSEKFYGRINGDGEVAFGQIDEASPSMGLSEAEAISAAASPSAKKMGRVRGRVKPISKPKKEVIRFDDRLEQKNMELKKDLAAARRDLTKTRRLLTKA